MILSSLRMLTPFLRLILKRPTRVQSSSSALKSRVPAFSEEYMTMDLKGMV